MYNGEKSEKGGTAVKKENLLRALRDTVPVMTGYLVLGMGFGILMHSCGYGILWSVSMSLFIYAGSMQYAAVGLMTGGASLLTVALTTLAVNARHLFYGISMIDRYRDAGAKKPYMIAALTDETYSLVSTTDRGTDYCFLVSVFDHLYWVGGTAIGALLGSAVKFDTRGIDFALTALFLTVFTDQWMKSKTHFPAAAGLLLPLLCLLLFGKDTFLIPSMCAILAALLLARKKVEK